MRKKQHGKLNIIFLETAGSPVINMWESIMGCGSRAWIPYLSPFSETAADLLNNQINW